jgi:hypothetical protein
MTLLRYRRIIAAVIAGVLGYLTTSLPPDLVAFGKFGRLLLAGHFADVYAQAWNQAGPVQLVINRLLLIGARDGLPSPLLMALVDIGLVLAGMTLCARSNPDALLARREAVVGVLTLMWLAAPMPWNGHPAEVAIPLCWAYAIALQRRGRSLPAAAMLALAGAIAPWALLGFPCLFAAAGLRRVCASGALAVALSVLGYLPFVLTGHFAMFEQTWGIADGTLIHVLAPSLHELTWWIRLLQGAVVAAGSGLFAWRHRDQRVTIGTAPLCATLLRVATDPLDFAYYWFPVAIATLLTLALMPGSEPRYRQALAMVLGYLALLSESARWTVPGALACLAVLLAMTTPRIIRADAAIRAGRVGPAEQLAGSSRSSPHR